MSSAVLHSQAELTSPQSVLALFIGVVARHWAYLFGALFAFLAALCLAVGMVIYTVIFARTISAVNGTRVEGVPLGIIVSYGYSLVSLCF